ncbi:hypothetical protein VOLCADRAFT_98115 [Volvox carteri f. nagariensis]|uniref:Methyltransferase type 12 domain-containing protein n=1 Tax=Volvox carteri f. nagariensis TaxID=3068 RepID=D8UEH3_VOLCA|nr:uncharacterized protein VOLCADRAFT_98115 [Volvox carteri f. nagariensis]EFJ41883.1 hypothetical protein VOLCADRAFT_98115 [Volvox carteri f. nagariensis]|eukprot:XP_002957081.1 hypothetical protein VOLCADRAFT_98115 [Volvox carteri f. nagariensis]
MDLEMQSKLPGLCHRTKATKIVKLTCLAEERCRSMKSFQASALHSSGTDLHRAEALYRRFLAVQPRHAHALHQLGALLTQLYGKEKDAEALRLVSSAVQLQPASAKFRNSLGVVHRTAGRWREAADAFERANEKDPLNVAVMMNLARALREEGRQQRAAEVYGAVTKLQPDHPSAHYRRGAILRSIRHNEAALAAFRQHLRLHPEHQAAKFWVAAITGDVEAMAAAPADMVAGLFDQYADHFDDHLVNKLQYRTPEALRDQLLAVYNSTAVEGSTVPLWKRCIDLGCGTGLMGPLLLPYCTALEGVDLSSGMIDQAAKRGCYNRLAVAELVAFLDAEAVSLSSSTTIANSAVPYDLLVAADVFVYIGDLAPVMRAAAAAAAPGAVLAFSTEALELSPKGKVHRGLEAAAAAAAAAAAEAQNPAAAASSPAAGGGGSCPGMKLQVTGRYAHSREYLERTGGGYGWEFVSVSQSVIRYNAVFDVCCPGRLPRAASGQGCYGLFDRLQLPIDDFPESLHGGGRLGPYMECPAVALVCRRRQPSGNSNRRRRRRRRRGCTLALWKYVHEGDVRGEK